MKRAEAWAPRYPGIAALSVTADDESGDVSDAKILSQHGEIPDDLIERIREG